MLSFYLIYPVCWLIGLLPYRAQFFFADVIYVILYHITGYRRRIVRENLAGSFPEKSSEELLEIERKFYHHLADVILETISMATMSEADARSRMCYLNVAEVEEATAGQSWISMMAHYGSWEYTISYKLFATHHDAVLAVYRPLHDRGFDKFYRKIRSRFGVIPTPMDDVGKEMVHRVRTKSPVALALIADQTPARRIIQNWTMFLGRETPFFTGSEKLSLKLHLPVYYMAIDKVSRGHYEGRFDLLYDGNEPVEPGEITRRYAERLERQIRQRPELWMWSHRRWKHERLDTE